jgi:hypothetical protein
MLLDCLDETCLYTPRTEYLPTRVLQPAGRVTVPVPGTGMKLTGTGRIWILGKRVRVGYGYEYGMDVKIGNLERQISFVKYRFI